MLEKYLATLSKLRFNFKKVALMDEIFRTSTALLNSLLKSINERYLETEIKLM